MKSPSPHINRGLMRMLTWCGIVAVLAATFLLYRWAEPTPAMLARGRSPGGANASIRLRNAPFAGYVSGARSWSLHAGQVDILRLPNASLTNIQSASILDIQDGLL